MYNPTTHNFYHPREDPIDYEFKKPTLKKNRAPDGRKLRSPPALIGFPSFSQVICAAGDASVLQFKVAGSFLGTMESTGVSIRRGGRPAKVDDGRRRNTPTENQQKSLLRSEISAVFGDYFIT